MSSGDNRMLLLDALKGIAAQLIVLHHLASYGPLADALSAALPAVSGFLFDYGRMAVQVFLVIGGYLAAHALLARGAVPAGNPLLLIWKRYCRLVPPFMVAMALAIGAAAIARLWLQDDAVPNAPSLGQLVAHGLLLHGVFDVPSLSVGVWYVAIDLQLYALLVLLVWAGYRTGGPKAGGVVAGGLLSALALAALFHFNRDSAWDDWGVYFFASYMLGIVACWVGLRRGAWYWLALATLVVAVALVIDFRLRIALALSIALVLAAAAMSGLIGRWPKAPVFGWLGKVSYSVFLVHFPVCLVVNALFERFVDGGERAAMAAILAAWGLSVVAGHVFHRHVESRRQWLPDGFYALARKILATLTGRPA